MADNETITCAWCKHILGIGDNYHCMKGAPAINPFNGEAVWPKLPRLDLRCGDFAHRKGSMVEVFDLKNRVVAVVFDNVGHTVYTRNGGQPYDHFVSNEMMRTAMNIMASELAADHVLTNDQKSEGSNVLPLDRRPKDD